MNAKNVAIKSKALIEMVENVEDCPICDKRMVLQAKHVTRKKNFLRTKYSTILELIYVCEFCKVLS